MSVNIKTASGLQKLSGNVTKNTISGALGYTPANPDSVNADLRTHTSDTDIHVSLAEKDKFLDYKQLNNLPNILDDESGEFSIVDKNGNTALQVDSTGVTNVASLNVDGQDVAAFMESTNAASNNHVTDQVRHITAAERTHWNDKSWHSLTDKPNIVNNDESTEFQIIDSKGNAAIVVDATGVTNVASLSIDGIDITNRMDGIESDAKTNLSNHTTREDNPHKVTAEQVGLGNVDNTSDANKPISTAQAAANATLQAGIDANAAAINSIKNGTDDAIAKNAEHAQYADVWTAKRKITLDGDASGDVELDGSTDVTLIVAVKDDSHTHLINPTAQTNSEGPLTFTSDSGNCAVTYTVNHKTTDVEGTYTRVTVDKYGHVTEGDNPDASWSSIVGRPDITPATDGNDTEVVIKDASDIIPFFYI